MHLHDMINHTKGHHHIITHEFELPESNNISQGTITLENVNDIDLSEYIELCKNISSLKDDNENIRDKIKALESDHINILQDNKKIKDKTLESDHNRSSSQYSFHNYSSIGNLNNGNKRKNSSLYDSGPSKRLKTENGQLEKLQRELEDNNSKIFLNEKDIEKLQRELEDNESKIFLNEQDITSVVKGLKKKLSQSFNLKTEQSVRAFINWAIHNKMVSRDHRRNITAINATDKKNDDSAMLDILSGLESIESADYYEDKKDTNIHHLKLVLKVKEQHYFKQTRTKTLCEIKSGYSDKMILILTKGTKNPLWVSTMYIQE